MIRSLRKRLVRRWRIFWLFHAGYGFWGRIGSRLASLGLGAYRQQAALGRMTRKGFISPKAEIVDVDLRRGTHIFVGEHAVITRSSGSGYVELGNFSQVNRDCILEILDGGSITIGEQVGLQRGCLLCSAVQPIVIQRRAEIAAYCAFYSFDHGLDLDREIFGQPLTSKGPILVEEDAWLGVGVKVMSGVTIGRGAVVGAGSVVTRDIPAFAIAAGVPARVIKYRERCSAPVEAPSAQQCQPALASSLPLS